jgi:hypothetical protein
MSILAAVALQNLCESVIGSVIHSLGLPRACLTTTKLSAANYTVSNTAHTAYNSFSHNFWFQYLHGCTFTAPAVAHGRRRHS